MQMNDFTSATSLFLAGHKLKILAIMAIEYSRQGGHTGGPFMWFPQISTFHSALLIQWRNPAE